MIRNVADITEVHTELLSTRLLLFEFEDEMKTAYKTVNLPSKTTQANPLEIYLSVIKNSSGFKYILERPC